MLWYCGVGEDSWESLGLQGDQSSQSWRKSALNSHWKDWCWSSKFGHLMQRTDSLEKTLMLGKIEAGGEGDNRGSDGWIASLIQWTWVWASSESWWWAAKPGICAAVYGVTKGRTRLSDWTELNFKLMKRNSPSLVIRDRMLKSQWGSTLEGQ